MARLARPVWKWPLLHLQCCREPISIHRAQLYEIASPLPSFRQLISPHHRGFRQWKRRTDALSPYQITPGEGTANDESDNEDRKSKNQRKREARRSVQWGIEISSFSPNQIKRILKLASLEQEVFDALMLVKRFGPDIREGKRRQYNYIGKLMREVDPALMDALILSTKDGDWSRLNPFPLSQSNNLDNDDDYEDEFIESETEGADGFSETANRWFDGLTSKDPQVSSEVYAIQSDDFNRQELRKLVRLVHDLQQKDGENESILKAKKSLSRFLMVLAKNLSREPTFLGE